LSTLGAKHDYIVLLDDNGNTVKEFHGKPRDGSFLATAGGPRSDNPLETIEPNQPGTYPAGANPVQFKNGEDYRPAASGTPEEMQALWDKGKKAVDDAIVEKRFLYDLTKLNGNTVASTFLRAIGIDDPKTVQGSNSVGFGDDLRTIQTNNPAVDPTIVPPPADKRSGLADDDMKTVALLQKPRTDWTEADAAHVEASDAYRDPRHPDHDLAVHAARNYRQRRAVGMRTGDGAVHVSAYDRSNGGHRVHVGDYTRSRPHG
jgi:hypothetical protein